jgi:WD40 repeat protein
MIQLPFMLSSLAFSGSDLLVCMQNTDKLGKANAVVRLSLSDAPAKISGAQENRSALPRNLTITGRNHNIGSGPILSLRVSPPLLDDSPPNITASRIAACCSDGSIYMLDGSELDLPLLGTIVVFPATGGAYPVYSCDFSVNGRYLRAFGKPFGATFSIKSDYYDLAPPPREEIDPKHPNLPPVLKTYFSMPLTTEEMNSIVAKSVAWATVSSPACPEASGVMRGTNTSGVAGLDDVNVTMIDAQGNVGDLLAVGYVDGSVRVFQLPVTGFAAPPLLDLRALSAASKVSVAFTAGGKQVVAVGKDGFIAVWGVFK